MLIRLPDLLPAEEGDAPLLLLVSRVFDNPVDRDAVAIGGFGAVRLDGTGTCVARFARRDRPSAGDKWDPIREEERSGSPLR